MTSAFGEDEAVRTGAGIGVLHDYLARDHVDGGRLVRVLPGLRATRSYWLAIHENLRDVARVRGRVSRGRGSRRSARFPAMIGPVSRARRSPPRPARRRRNGRP
ncbi:hypothetical protein KTN05_13990 [Paracoccus sp. Z118]|nr:hypothetical protein [Paracoccus sp. Z118]